MVYKILGASQHTGQLVLSIEGQSTPDQPVRDFETDAATIHRVLRTSIPSGTFDRLLYAMMKDAATGTTPETTRKIHDAMVVFAQRFGNQ